jgi:CheY-like chemotaxis protein
MQHIGRTRAMLVADDDPDDRLMIREALKEVFLTDGLSFVEDGEELLDYLRHRGRYAEAGSSPTPGLILLDLNMPKTDGRTALREIKSDPALRRIPVVVLTTSADQEDICRTYDLGVSSFILKPFSFDELVEVMRTLTRYWFEVVVLPPPTAMNAPTVSR